MKAAGATGIRCILLLLAGIFAITAQAEERPLIKIGLILPLGGGMAHVGTAFRDAARMAAAEIPKGSKFSYELIFEDDELQSAKVASAAQKLITIDKVDALVSTWSYGGIVVAPMAEKARRIHFGVAWDPAVAKGSFNFIHLTPPREFIKGFLAGFKKKGYRKIASFGWHESGSLFFLDELERLAPQNGFTLVKRTEFDGADRDFRSALLNAERAKADVFLVNLSAPAIDIFVKQMAELKITTPVTSITGFEVATDLAPLEGKWYVSDSTVSDDFAERFTKQYGHNHLYGVGNFYDAVKLIAFLFEQAPGPAKPQPEQVLEATKKIGLFNSIFGPLQLDSEGIISYQPVFRKIVAGKRITVGLDDI
jgi:ABC-type branched-subunit amino acid transport system substrate-binding protein